MLVSRQPDMTLTRLPVNPRLLHHSGDFLTRLEQDHEIFWFLRPQWVLSPVPPFIGFENISSPGKRLGFYWKWNIFLQKVKTYKLTCLPVNPRLLHHTGDILVRKFDAKLSCQTNVCSPSMTDCLETFRNLQKPPASQTWLWRAFQSTQGYYTTVGIF